MRFGILFIMSFLGTGGFAQAQSERMAADPVEAALRWGMEASGAEAAAVDGARLRGFTVPHRNESARPLPAGRVRAIQRALGAGLGSYDELAVCQGDGLPSCELPGYDAVLWADLVVADNTSAVVWISSIHTIDLVGGGKGLGRGMATLALTQTFRGWIVSRVLTASHDFTGLIPKK